MNEEIDSKFYDEIVSFIKKSTTIPNKTKIIYQYTNIDALFSGVVVKEPKLNEEICLWASNQMYLNDPNETVTGQKFFEEIVYEYFVEKDNNKNKSNSYEGTDCFITSFSATKDSLPMWSMYGKNGAGIALGFDKNIIHKGSNDALYKCIYLDKVTKNKIASLCKKYKGKKIDEETFIILFIAIVLATLFNVQDKEEQSELKPIAQFMLYAKEPAYKYEDEVRLLIQPNENLAIKYRCQNNLIIPYIENFFPKKALKEIWVGPTNDMERTIKSLETYLNYMGFSDVEIKKSEVPYRI